MSLLIDILYGLNAGIWLVILLALFTIMSDNANRRGDE